MPLVRKRRPDLESRGFSPEPAASRRRITDAAQDASPDPDNGSIVSDGDNDDNGDSSQYTQSPSHDAVVKKLVRLALACEYSRQPIRRTDITAKVFGEQGSREFKYVFDEAQRVLRERFGMQMVELPLKEKITVSQRRAAQRAEKPSTTSKSWIVTSTLPAAYRTPTILPPSRAPSTFTESTYIALYTFIIALVMLCGGSIEESRLDRCLRRVNADSYTPLDRTDRLLARMCKDGYLVRHRDTDGGEEVVEYFVGPRGKVEVGVNGVSGLVKEVYGFGMTGEANNGGNGESAEDFEKRLKRSLGIRDAEPGRHEGEEVLDGGGGGNTSNSRRGRRGYGDSDDD
ncbi:hypothetical protein VTO42DRAFT_8670 [Malbranchea cinnamomea]